MFVVTRLRVPDDDGGALVAAVDQLIGALAARPGFRDAELGRAADEAGLWALVTRWDGVGAYRRALSAAEVKITGAPVWVHAVDEPGAYLTDWPSRAGVSRSEAGKDSTDGRRAPGGRAGAEEF